jgi:predicted AAA+ superfamily ATPase
LYFCRMRPANRDAQSIIENWLGKGKVIILTGARQVGKTTLFRKIVENKRDVLWLNADESKVREKFQLLSTENLKRLVSGKKYVIIDEIQRIPDSGLLLKLLADNFKSTQVMATGSSALDIADKIYEPLTGRHFLFHLHPLMISEMYAGNSPFEIEQKLPFHLVYGCYPDIYNRPDDAEFLLKNLATQYLYKDILGWKEIRKPQLLEKLLQLLAYQIGSQVSVAELGNQLKVKSETVESYLDLLEKSFLIFRLPAFSNNPRKEVSKMNKIYFWDNGIRNSLIDDFDEISIRRDQGLLWENFVISERRKWLAWNKPNVKTYFWRSYNQSEVDYIEKDKQKISAFEIKWSLKNKNVFSRAFTNSYPKASTQVITPNDIDDIFDM